MHISGTPVMRGGEGDGPNIGRAGGIRQYHCIDLDGASANLKRTAMDRLAAGSTYRYMAPHLLDIVKNVGTGAKRGRWQKRSEEHTSELQSLMRISYAVICLKKKKYTQHTRINNYTNDRLYI